MDNNNVNVTGCLPVSNVGIGGCSDKNFARVVCLFCCERFELLFFPKHIRSHLDVSVMYKCDVSRCGFKSCIAKSMILHINESNHKVFLIALIYVLCFEFYQFLYYQDKHEV